MRLTRYTDFSLRLLIYIGLDDTGRLFQIRDIAAAYGISENHLMKVVNELGRLGFIETVRGRGGGVRLARPAAEINIGAVVRAVEQDMALVECLGPDNTCPIVAACALMGVLCAARDAFLAVLDRQCLSDLVREPQPLRALLAVPPS